MSMGTEVWNVNSGPADTDISSLTIPLSTSGTNRIAVLIVKTNNTSTHRAVSSVTSGGGLTWALYTAYDFNSSGTSQQRIEVWWAYCAAQQTANTVTVTLAGSSGGIALAIGAVSGLPASRYTNPFDADPTLPGKTSNPSTSSADASQTFSTAADQQVVIAIWGSAITNIGNGTDSVSMSSQGFAQQGTVSTDGTAIISSKLEVYTKVNAVQQVSVTVNMGSTKNWGMVLVAVGGNIIFPHAYVNCGGF